MTTDKARAKRFLLRWLPVNGAFAALAVAGTVFGLTWAGNIFVFALWVFNVAMLPIDILGGICYWGATRQYDHHPEASYKMLQAFSSFNEKTSTARWFDVSYDVALLALLASHGWLFASFGQLLLLASCEWHRFLSRRAKRQLVRIDCERAANEFLASLRLPR